MFYDSEGIKLNEKINKIKKPVEISLISFL